MDKTITLDMTKLNFVRSADQIAGKSAFLINGKLEISQRCRTSCRNNHRPLR